MARELKFYRTYPHFSIQKKISKQEMIIELNRDIRRYAKKQLAYWNRNSEITWLDPKNKKKIELMFKKWLEI